MAKITIEKQLADKYIIEVEDQSILNCIQKVSVFAEVEKCTCCGSKNIHINYHKAMPKQGPNAGKTFEYYDFVCRDCKAKANIGQYQSGGVFLKAFERYEGGNQSEQENPNSWPTDNTVPTAPKPSPSNAYGGAPARF